MILRYIQKYYMDPDESQNKTASDIDDTEIEISANKPTPEVVDGDTSVVMNLESMIKTNIAQTGKLREEMGKLKEMLADIFANDPLYQEHEKIAKDAAKQKQNTKKQVLKQPQAADLDTKIKTMSSEIKENNQALSEYLQEFARISGITEIEGEDGEIRQIVYDAKLVKKSSR